ncbi:MAG: hypothetical protein AB7W59_16355 [Acidimicrobiia bacterium]
MLVAGDDEAAQRCVTTHDDQVPSGAHERNRRRFHQRFHAARIPTSSRGQEGVEIPGRPLDQPERHQRSAAGQHVPPA